MAFEPDIIVSSRDGTDFLVVVEAKPDAMSPGELQNVEAQLKRYMFGMRCPLGLLIAGPKLRVLKDTYRTYTPDSIETLGEFDLPAHLEITNTPSHGRWRDPQAEFEGLTQHWLESLTDPAARAELSQPLRSIVEEHLAPALESGDVRAAHFRFHASRASDRR